MTHRVTRTAALAAGLLLATALGAARAADENAAAEFDQLFGAEVQRVGQTPDPADDLELARTLVTAAERSADKPALRTVLAAQALELAVRSPEGGDVAAAAVELSGEPGESERAKLERVADVRQRVYAQARGEQKAAAAETLIGALVAAGDAALAEGDSDGASTHYRKAFSVASAVRSGQRDTVKARLDAAVQARRVDQMIEAAKSRLKSNPDDRTAAVELINLYVVEKDDPAEARKYTFVSDDEQTNENVKLATASPDTLTDAQAFDMGEWYRGLADSAKTPVSRAAMLRRALGYYDHYLAVHTTEDVYRTKATMAHKHVTEQLAASDAPAPAAADSGAITPGRWYDLMPKTDAARHARRGVWEKKGDKLGTRGEGMAQLMFPVQVEGSYELSVKFERTGGTAFALYLPIKDNGVLAVAGYSFRGRFIVHGLTQVDGADVQDRRNPTRVDAALGDLDGAKVMQVKVQTRDDEVAIAVSLNGRTITTYSGPIRSLTTHAVGTSLNPKAPGVFSWGAGVVVHDAKIKMTDGSADWIPDAEVRELNGAERAADDVAERLGDGVRRGFEDLSPEDRERLRRRLGQ